MLSRLHDSKVSDNSLRKLGAGLKPDSSLLVIFVDPTGAAAATKALIDAGAVVTTEGMDAEAINGMVAAYEAERAKK